jgi:hypothetical protein
VLTGISRPKREKEYKSKESCKMKSFVIFRPVHFKILLEQSNEG